MVYDKSSTIISYSDDWRAGDPAHHLPETWTGETVFELVAKYSAEERHLCATKSVSSPATDGPRHRLWGGGGGQRSAPLGSYTTSCARTSTTIQPLLQLEVQLNSPLGRSVLPSRFSTTAVPTCFEDPWKDELFPDGAPEGMYGWKTAPMTRELHFADILSESGPNRLRGEPNMHYSLCRDLFVMPHVDDILAVGLYASTDWFYGGFSKLLPIGHLGELRPQWKGISFNICSGKSVGATGTSPPTKKEGGPPGSRLIATTRER